MGGIGKVNAEDVHVQWGGIGAGRADTMSVEMGSVGWRWPASCASRRAW